MASGWAVAEVVIRKLRPEDIEPVAQFAELGLQPDRYPLLYSPAKLRAAVQHFHDSEADYHRVAFKDGRVVGVIAAAVADMPFFERHEAHVCAFYATEPGVGRLLLAGLLDWMDRHFMVMRIVWPHNPGMRPSVQRLARMCAKGRQVAEMSMTVFFR